MGKSRFEGMETSVREQTKITENGADNKVQIEELEAELLDIDREVELTIKEIKSTPIDKELLKEQAKVDMENKLSQTEMECQNKVLELQNHINQSELDMENVYKQAKIDLEKMKMKIKKVEEEAKMERKAKDIRTKQEYDIIVSSVDNTDKTLQLKIEKATMSGDKRKKEIEIELRSLKARDKVNEEKKAVWVKLYDDTVEISKQPTS